MRGQPLHGDDLQNVGTSQRGLEHLVVEEVLLEGGAAFRACIEDSEKLEQNERREGHSFMAWRDARTHGDIFYNCR